MDDRFYIYPDRLNDGRIERFTFHLAPELLVQEEKEFSIPSDVEVQGRAYLTDKDLVIHFDLESTIQMPCRICNELASVPIQVANYMQIVEKSEIRNGFVDLLPLIREAFLLELPQYATCEGGNCKNRDAVHSYLKKEADEQVYHPFANLTED